MEKREGGHTINLDFIYDWPWKTHWNHKLIVKDIVKYSQTQILNMPSVLKL